MAMSELTDAELDDLAATADATDPARAAEVRHLKAWRRDRPLRSVRRCDRLALVLR